jgi:dihydroorotase
MFTIEGNIVNKEGQKRARVEIDDAGIITKVTEPMGQADLILDEELIFPGFIDIHVHAREDTSHKNDYKEDFSTAGDAAVAGGVVAFADMPNNPIPPVDAQSYEAKKKLTEKSKVEIVLYAGIGAQTNPLKKTVPYKVFMGHSVGDLFFTTLESLDTALARYAGQHVSFHCEDPKILEKCDTISHTHEEKRPQEAEILAVENAIALIKKYNLIGRICHVSTSEGMKKIIEAKKNGINITVEVTPHHLFFDEAMFTDETRKLFQVNPPIRQPKENRLELIRMLKNGDIDYLATDHAPHTLKEKEQCISGLPLLDTYGPFTTWLMSWHDFTPEDIARVCAQKPANFINTFINEKYGEIKEGFVGSLTVLNLNKKILIENKNMKTKCGWSPFNGIEFPGSVVATVVKGKLYENK